MVDCDIFKIIFYSFMYFNNKTQINNYEAINFYHSSCI